MIQGREVTYNEKSILGGTTPVILSFREDGLRPDEHGVQNGFWISPSPLPSPAQKRGEDFDW